MEVETLLAPDTSARKAMIKRSTISYPDVHLDMFTHRIIKKGEVVGY